MRRAPDPEILHSLGEHFAAGAFELADAPPVSRWSRALRRFFEHRPVPLLEGHPLCPSGPSRAGCSEAILVPSYSFTWEFDETALSRRLASCGGRERATLEALGPEMRELGRQLDVIRTPHAVGGKGYTHSIPNYGRVLGEGLDRYQERIIEGARRAEAGGDPRRAAFFAGLLDVLEGIAAWHRRIVGRLAGMPSGAPRLRAALARVPFSPARSFFEALAAYNFVFYLDGCDNPGRVDLELAPYYERDLASGATSHGEAVELLRAFWNNVDLNEGWSAGIGGSTPEGRPAYSDLTLACLEAARGMRRPNLHLHVRRDMPPEFWEEAFTTLATGCGLPALNNEELYRSALREADLGIREEDLAWRNGGGCTETMIHGRSNVGSLDAGINLALVLERTVAARLESAASFEELFRAFADDARAAVHEVAAEVSADQEAKSLLRPQPMRSLLVEDCIERGLEFNAGGARYNWSVVNVAGLANVVDSLAAIREVVFETHEASARQLSEALATDFAGARDLAARLERCPRFGNDDARVDRIAAEVSSLVFRELLAHRPWRGGRFLPACLMFVTYASAGAPVGALPDARRAGAPLADSAGPYQGRDRRGPTAMLHSVASLAHRLAPGTLVVNARLSREFFASEEDRRKLRDLVRGYFDLGGMQLQINVVDQEVLRDALEHPERHGDLIVRIGGYSEYFNRLSRDLQLTILQRTEHGAPQPAA
jgi:formate C-acetyltransferase